MTINIKLLDYQKLTPEGYPLVVKITHKGKPKQRLIGYSFPEHWNDDEQIILKRHPDYDILMPILADLKIRMRKVVLQRFEDVDKALRELFKIDFSEILFTDHTEKLISEMKAMAEKLGKTDVKAKNKLLGNVKVYENVLEQFKPFADTVTLKSLDYEMLMRFRNFQTGLGNKKPTVHLYLRTLRAIYNKGVLLYKLPDEKPFKGVFSKLATKSYSSRKKSLDRESVAVLEGADMQSAKQKYIDLWLLQFYFGGCDLIDLYYLKKKQIRRGRVIFERGKVDGPPINLKIHPKALALMEKYPSDDEWLFPWAKDIEAYGTFRRTLGRGLIYVQEKLGIEVLPDGGNLSIKVARHTFANLAKGLMIHEDIIRELMGHERDDVDNYYKAQYSESVRDEALFLIIEGKYQS